MSKISVCLFVLLHISLASNQESQSYVPRVDPVSVLVRVEGESHTLQCITPDFVTPDNVTWIKLPPELLDIMFNTICMEDLPASNESGSGSGTAASGSGENGSGVASGSGQENGNGTMPSGSGQENVASGSGQDNATEMMTSGSGQENGNETAASGSGQDNAMPSGSGQNGDSSNRPGQDDGNGSGSGSGEQESRNLTSGSGIESGDASGSGNRMNGSGLDSGEGPVGSGDNDNVPTPSGSIMGSGGRNSNNESSSGSNSSELSGSGIGSENGMSGSGIGSENGMSGSGMSGNGTTSNSGNGNSDDELDSGNEIGGSSGSGNLGNGSNNNGSGSGNGNGSGMGEPSGNGVGSGSRTDESGDGSDALLDMLEVVGTGSTLNLSSVMYGDEGYYTCRVQRRTQSCVSNQSAIVYIAPDVSVMVLNGTDLLNRTDLLYSRGDDIVLLCETLGGPENTIQWLLNDMPLAMNMSEIEITANNSTLALSNVSAAEGGVYTCQATNPAGTRNTSTPIFISPYFTFQPQDMGGANGTTVILMCVAESFPYPTYEWMRADGRAIPDTAVMKNSFMLKLSPLMFGDEGVYFCTVTAEEIDVSIESEYATISVSPEGSVRIVSSEGEMVDYRNTTTVLTCEAMGGPNNTFSWSRSSGEFGGNVKVGGEVLVIQNVMAADGGLYSCEVSNTAGTGSDTINITVSARITVSPKADDDIPLRTDFTLTCSATGFPTPSITWLFNGISLDMISGERRVIKDESSAITSMSSLTVLNTTVTDTGNYTCLANNSIGEPDTADVQVIVRNIPEQLQNVTAVSIGSREINLTWIEPHDNNAPITGYQVMYMEPEFVTGERQREVNTSEEMAAITELFPGVDYMFIVIAYNEIGQSLPSDSLLVRTLDERPASPPENVRVMVQSSTELMVTWDAVVPMNRNGIITMYEVQYEPLETFGGFLQTQNTAVDASEMMAVLSNLSEFVTYNISVRAYTSVGPGPYSTGTINKTDEAAPASPPENVTAMAMSSTEIMVSWDEVPPIDQNGIITMYEVQYEPLETFNGTLQTQTRNSTNSMDFQWLNASNLVDIPDMFIVLEDLEEFVNYTITVRAYTSAGAGPYSSGVTEMTEEAAPASPPENVRVMVLSSTEIEVSWDEVLPIDQNGIITAYEVQYEPLETFDEQIETRTRNVSVSIETVTLNVSEFVSYNISVRAYTRAGVGPYSAGITETSAQDTPDSPPDNVDVIVLSSTEIMVSWDEVPPIDQNGIITMYEVQYEPLETFGEILETRNMFINASQMMAALSNLSEFVTYNISVRAYTSVGAGPYSTGITNTTNEAAPASSPANVSTIVLSSTKIMVSWDEVPPIDQNGNITMYEVRYEPLETFGRILESQNTTVDVSETMVVLANLSEFVTYNISVRAYTSVGAGPYSTGIANTTDEAAPASPPANVTAVVTSSTEIMVSWDEVPPIDQNGNITMYEVQYEPLETFVGQIWTQTTNVSAPETSVMLENLEAFINYTVFVRAYTSEGEGPYSEGITRMTLQDVPSAPPERVNALALSPSSVMVTWDPPPRISQNGILINYEVRLVRVEDGDEQTWNTTELDITIIDLFGDVVYNVSVRAYTVVGPGPYGTPPQNIRTPVGTPGNISAPPPVNEDSITNNSAVITWNRPVPPNGEILGYNVSLVAVSLLATPSARRRRRQSEDVVYCVERSQADVNRNIPVEGDVTRVELTGLAPFTQYEFQVQGRTSAGSGAFSPPGTFSTLPGRPSEVTGLMAMGTSSSSIRVTWDPPRCPYGAISSYMVFYRQLDAATRITIATTQLERTITNLEPFQNYTISVQAVGSGGLGDTAMEVVNRTYGAVPDTPPTLRPEAPPTSPTTTTVISILIPDPRQINTGRVIFCAVVVVVGKAFDKKDLYNNAPPFSEGVPFYITAAWDEEDIYGGKVPSILTVGSGNFFSVDRIEGRIQYYNAPLRSSTMYSIFVRYDIDNDTNPAVPLNVYSSAVTSRTAASAPVGVVVGILLSLVVVIIIVIVVLVILLLYSRNRKVNLGRIKGRDSPTTNIQLLQTSSLKEPSSIANHHAVEEEEETFTDLEPVPVDDFKAYVRQHHMADNELFTKEYKEVEPKHSPTSKATQNPNNTTKNRYANITAYDHSRVKLEPIEGEPNSDYINANYLDGYRMANSFIAAQGPVPASVPDFWRMIWEKKVSTIVMVTNLEEKGRIKCHRYWPSDSSKTMTVGSFEIETQETLVLAEYTIRTFSLQKAKCKDEKIVRQFHFTVWPDHGVPEYPAQLLHFVRKVMQEPTSRLGPMLVHCSAGVGRTGTFITMFTQLERIKAEGSVDIFGFVRCMRRRRCYMVQTEDQYIFIHDALLEAIECGVTEVAARDLAKQLKRLKADGGLAAEFKKVATTIHKRMSQTVFSQTQNKPKNQQTHPKKTPYDGNRVILSISASHPSDYINASHIDGYHKLKAYIATQDPLPNTVDDFWRMVWENECTSIVKITKEKEEGEMYWPDAGVINHANLQVIFHSQDQFPDYVQRTFKMVDTTDGSSREVKQYQFQGWPGDPNMAPENGSGLIDLIGQVQKWQRSSEDMPIVVHCSDGCGLTGTFIAVSILLERLKTEGVVDVFHTVRTLRLQRPELVATLAQYEFCYKTVLEFLDSFELYSNFK